MREQKKNLPLRTNRVRCCSRSRSSVVPPGCSVFLRLALRRPPSIWNNRRKLMSQPALRVVEKDNMDRQKALDAALGQIERAFGKGSIMRLGAREAQAGETEVVSTGSLGLDIALGIGGLPRGRIIEIYGPESS